MDLVKNIAMQNLQAFQKQIYIFLKFKNILIFITWWKLKKYLDIEEKPFEKRYIVEVAINNETNEFRKMIANLENNGNMILQKINMQVLSIMSMKTNDDLKIGNVNIKSFTENWIRLENYQEAFKHTEKDAKNLN